MAAENSTTNKAKRFVTGQDRLPLLLLAAVAVLMTLMTYPNLVVTAPTYSLGDVAEKNIKSPRDFLVQDDEATRSRQKTAVDTVLTVYDFDEALANRIVDRVNRAFSLIHRTMADWKEKKAAYEKAAAERKAAEENARLLELQRQKEEEERLALQHLEEEKRARLMDEADTIYEAPVGLEEPVEDNLEKGSSQPLVLDQSSPAPPDEEKALAGMDAQDSPAPMVGSLGSIQKKAQAAPPKQSPLPSLAAPAPESQVVWQAKQEFEKALGIQVSDGAYSILISENFDPSIAALIVQIVKTILDNGVVANKELLLLETSRGITLRAIGTESEESVQSLKRFYSIDQAKAMVRIVGDPILQGLDYNLLNLIVDFCQRLLSSPNITMNRHETENRRRLAADAVNPVLFQVKAGEMLVREGERVNERHLLILTALHAEISQGQIIIKSFGIGFLILVFLWVFYVVYFKPMEHSPLKRSKDIALVSMVLLTFFLVARLSLTLAVSMPHDVAAGPFPSAFLFGAPLAAGSMVVCVFLGLPVALPFSIILTFCATALWGHPFVSWAYFLINGTMAAWWVRACRERNVFIKAGFLIGLLNMWLVLALYLHQALPLGENFLADSAAALVGGVLSGVLTIGLVPLIEIAFSYTTDIKLLELANLDRPVLRRLMIEAPGTYHHSVVVGSMVEAAAARIGANPLLAKVGGYYHDIGKIKKPLYFIENQVGGKNRHDKLAPSMSSLILTAHVRDGVEMAQTYRLGGDIRDIIQQHHGSSLIQFFYDKATKLKGPENVSQDDFRYPGPKPQTKEAGLVMLADVVEAASRTLENPTPARIQGNVQRLINKIFSDGQLDECELTLKDLHQIAKSFNQILAGIYHHRVEYETTPKANGKGKKAVAHSDNKQPKPREDSQEKAADSDEGRLKRLGIG